MGLLLGLIAAYLLGSIPTAALLARRALGVDLSVMGSGTLGASNLARLHRGLGAAALALDAAKGWAPAALGAALDPGGWSGPALGLAAVAGHCWSAYRWRAARKGGKGVATLLGATLALAHQALPVILGGFALVTWLSGYRAAGTLAAAGLGVAAFALAGAGAPLIGFGLGGLALLAWTHRENLRRMRAGSEERGFFPAR
jgi:acyl phosphate:glycerol-3-phosphate acyltransferase